MRTQLAFAAAVLTLFFTSTIATATDYAAVWTGVETKVPVTPDRKVMVRGIHEVRFGGTRDGLSFLLTRVGGMWDMHPNFGLNVNAVQALNPDAHGLLRPDTRFELEPNIRGSIGDLQWNLRQRFDMRWYSENFVPRYRAQVKLLFRPPSWSIAPFAFGEAFLITRGRASELRAFAGMSLFGGTSTRFDVGYLARPLRVGQTEEWTLTHAAVFFLTFTPKMEPLLSNNFE